MNKATEQRKERGKKDDNFEGQHKRSSCGETSFCSKRLIFNNTIGFNIQYTSFIRWGQSHEHNTGDCGME